VLETRKVPCSRCSGLASLAHCAPVRAGRCASLRAAAQGIAATGEGCLRRGSRLRILLGAVALLGGLARRARVAEPRANTTRPNLGSRPRRSLSGALARSSRPPTDPRRNPRAAGAIDIGGRVPYRGDTRLPGRVGEQPPRGPRAGRAGAAHLSRCALSSLQKRSTRQFEWPSRCARE
jgi:hypothetical protein